MTTITADYWCEVTLSASGRDFPISGYQTGTPRLAVRWMREQVARMANLMDPDPGAAWLAAKRAGTRFPLVEVTGSAPDAPQELRKWRSDYKRQAAAMETLAVGGWFSFSADDGTTAVNFSARPLVVSFVDDWRLRVPDYVAA